MIEKDGRRDTVRNQILRAYAMLFCDDIGIAAGQAAGPDEVEATADRLYSGSTSFDPKHWYRMRYHFSDGGLGETQFPHAKRTPRLTILSGGYIMKAEMPGGGRYEKIDRRNAVAD